MACIGNRDAMSSPTAYTKCYLVSWHLRTWVHFLARHEISTNNYITAVSKFWLIKRNFRTITWGISCYNFKTLLKSWEIWKIMLLNVSIAHMQPRIYGFSWTVILIGSSQSTETYLGGEELWFESRVITVQQSKPNLHIRKLKWHGCINKHVCISVLHLWTLLGRFRVGFGVGNISNTIEH